MSLLPRDLRFGLRMLVRTPAVTVASVLALGLGIAVCAAMYSIVYGTLWRGLPVEGAERVMVAYSTDVRRGELRREVTVHDYLDWRRQQASFESLEAFALTSVNIRGTDRPERYAGAAVSTSSFAALGIEPLLGRGFLAADGDPAADAVIILGHSVWRDRYGSDPQIVGRTVFANGVPTTVVGVMPEGMAFPAFQHAWLPLRVDPVQLARDDGPRLTVFGRLREGQTARQAESELAAIAARLETEYPDTNEGRGARVQAFALRYLGGGSAVVMMWASLGGVFFVLLIACGNVTNLLLSQAIDRAGEMAIRTALGARRSRVMRQLLVEVGLLAALGGVVGVVLARLGIGLFQSAVADTPPPFFMVIAVDTPVLLFVAGVVILATFLAGTLPALQATRTDVAQVLGDESRSATGLRVGRISRALVIAQIAFSCALLAGAGLMVRSVVNLSQNEYGFAPDQVYAASLVLDKADYPAVEARRDFADALQRGLAAQPGVDAVSLTSHLPVSRTSATRFMQEGESYPSLAELPRTRRATIAPGFFAALGLAPQQGREFGGGDTPDSLPVAMVNARFVRQFFPSGEALDRRIRLGDDEPWITIVGVVANLYMDGPDLANPPGVYLPLSQSDAGRLNIVLRARDDPEAIAAMVRTQVGALDPDLPISWVKTMDQVIYEGAWQFWIFGGVFVVFGLVALALASIGLYGVMSFSVQRRIPEMGIRMALGASGRDILRLVMSQGGAQVALGLLPGLVLAALATRSLASLLYQTRAADPVLFTAIAVVLGLTGLLACLVPALRASRIDPMAALRSRR